MSRAILSGPVCSGQTRDEERCCNLLSVPGLIAADKTTPPSWVNMATGLCEPELYTCTVALGNLPGIIFLERIRLSLAYLYGLHDLV